MTSTEDLGQIKRDLAELGVNSRGWRLYADYGYTMFFPLGKHWCDLDMQGVRGDNEVAWLTILQACEMDVLPPPELLQSIAHWHVPGPSLAAIPPMFLRAAWKACVAATYNEGGLEDFIESEVIPLAQWFFSSGSYKTLEVGQLKAGWSNLMKLRRDWVDAEAKKLGTDDWPPIVRKYESGAYRMLALSHAHQLQEEGEQMRHCVGGYADRCRWEPLRIFSIRSKKGDQRVATLSLREVTPGNWDFDQLKGPSNADVEQRVWHDADGLRLAMNQVSRCDAKTRAFLDFIHGLAGQP